MKRLPMSLLAILMAAVGVALLAFLSVGPMGKTAHAVPTNPNITQIAIDMDPANGGGNTGSALGPIDWCIVVAPGATFPINVVMSGLPATPLLTDRLAGFEFDIGYPTSAPAPGAPPNLTAPGLVLGNDDDLDGLYDEDTQVEPFDQDGNNGDGEEGPNGPNPLATIGHDARGESTPDFPANVPGSVILPNSNDISVANGLAPGAWNVWRAVAFKLSAFTVGPKSGTMDWIKATAGTDPGVYLLTLFNVQAASMAAENYNILTVSSAWLAISPATCPPSPPAPPSPTPPPPTPVPPPPDVAITSSTGTSSNGTPMQISGTPTLVIQKNITACVPVEPPVVKMTFSNSSTASAAMANVGGTLFQATFPGPFPSGTASMRIDVDCPPDTAGYPANPALAGPEDVIQIGNIIFFDPSGTILNACTGGPLSGATVTLLQDDGAGNFVVPPTTDHIPVTNPQITPASGSYGWVVVPGTYKVQAAKAGFVTNTSPAVTVPPAVTGLDIALTPATGCSLVGGIFEAPDVAHEGAAAGASSSSGGLSPAGIAAIAGGLAAAAIAVAAAGWYARRRFVRR